LFNKAKKEYDDHIVLTDDWNVFVKKLDDKCFILTPFCGDGECEDRVKKDSAKEEVTDAGGPAMGAKSLCIPFDQPKEIVQGQKCVHPGCGRPAQYYTLFGRSY